MNRSKVPLRRLIFALAVPVVAVGAIALTAGAASSSARNAAAVAADEPGPNQQQTEPNNPNLTPKSLFTFKSFKTFKSPIPSPSSTSGSPSRSASKSPSGSPSASKSGSASPRASGSAGPSRGGAPGAAATNCAGHTATPPTTVQIGQAGGKEALVDQDGCAVYVFSKDTRTTSACDATCLHTFFPVPGPGKAGNGVDQANLATFTRADGTVQLTFFGKQLYHFSGDKAPGAANGQRVNQSWFLVNKSGNAITG
jgi:predicted lipoprotein with Yx(FWY)xxD motif